MKKQILLFASLFSSIFISNAQITNNSFETWGSRSNTIGVPPLLPNETFSYTDPNNWSSGNQATGHSMLGNGFYVTKDLVNFYDGTASARLESNEITVLGNVVTIPGLIVSGEFIINPVEFATGTINPFAVPGVGFPVVGRPSKVVGYYKYAPMGTDTCEIACAVVDSARNQVAFGIFKTSATTSGFTRFEINLTYTSCNRPDTICIIGASSPFTSGAASAGVDGSTLWLDSFGVSFTPTPIIYPSAGNDTITTYKNHPITITTLFANDNDCDGGTLSITGTTTPLHGTNTNTGTTVTYTPTANYVGSDIFTYSINDGTGGTATAIVSVNVLNNVGIAPISESEELSIFPNPVSNILNINITEESAPYFIADLSGKKIKSGNFKNYVNTLDLSDLENGSYIINVNGVIRKFNVTRQ